MRSAMDSPDSAHSAVGYSGKLSGRATRLYQFTISAELTPTNSDVIDHASGQLDDGLPAAWRDRSDNRISSKKTGEVNHKGLHNADMRMEHFCIYITHKET